MTDALFDCEDVTKRYGEVTALDGVDLSVTPGTVHCLAGPNGSGKSTLLGVLAGLVGPSSGSVARRSEVGVGFQRPRAYADLTVGENLSVFGRLAGADADRRDAVADSLALGGVRDRRVGALSDGFARKLDVALALLGEPPLLVLDEPLGNLDDHTAGRLLDVVEAYPDEERAVVVASHDIERFGDRVDRLTVLHRGDVLLDDATENLGPPNEAYLSALRAATER